MSKGKFILILSLMCEVSFATDPNFAIKTSKLDLEFKTTRIASLVYQIDCLAGLIVCEEHLVKDFWNEQSWTADDEKAIKDWAAIYKVYSEISSPITELSDNVAKGIGFPLRNNSVNFDKKVRIASFISQDIAQYKNALSLLMVPMDVERSVLIIERFQARHQKWWRQEGEKRTEAFIKEFMKIMKQKNLVPFVEQVASFYESEVSSRNPVYFHMIYLPGSKSHTNGEQIENHSLIEFLSGEKMENRIDVVLHEFFHYLYRTVSAEKHASLVKSFLQHSDPANIASYNLLNEVLATAFGNGMVFQKVSTIEHYNRAFAKSKTFYDDIAIDSVAKNLLPKLEENLQNKRSLYDKNFVNDYIEVAKKAMGNNLMAPNLALRSMVAVYQYGVDFNKDLSIFTRKILAGSTWISYDFESDKTFGMLKDCLHLSGLVLVKPTGLDALKTWDPVLGAGGLAKIRERIKRQDHFIHVIQRSVNSWIFVVVANPGEQAQEQLTKLANAEKATDLN